MQINNINRFTIHHPLRRNTTHLHFNHLRTPAINYEAYICRVGDVPWAPTQFNFRMAMQWNEHKEDLTGRGPSPNSNPNPSPNSNPLALIATL